MGLIGRLDLTVPDLLQILSLSGKTGKLRLSRLGSYGEIGFKDGKVIFANSNSSRNTLGQILVNKEHISEEALMGALEQQHLSGDNKRLGAILLERGAITPPVLQEALRYQVEQVITEFLLWEIGFFRFDTTELVSDDAIAVDAHDFLVKSGFNPDQLLLEGLRRMDERRKAVKDSPSFPDVALPATSDRGLAGRIEKTPAAKKPTPPAPKPTPAATSDQLPAGWLEKARGEKKVAPPAPKPTPPLATDGPPVDWLEDVHEAATASPARAAAPPPPPSRAEKAPEPGKVAPPTPKTTPPPAADVTPPDWLEDGHEAATVSPARAAAPPLPPSRAEKAPEPGKVAPPAPKPTPPLATDGPPVDWLEDVHEAATASPAQAAAPPPPPSRAERGLEAGKPGPDMAKATSPPISDHAAPETTSGQMSADHGKDPLPGVALDLKPEVPVQEIASSNIINAILDDSPIAPWVPIMHIAPDFLARGVVLFEQGGHLSGYDQFGVYAGIEGGNIRVQNMHIPLNEGSIFSGVFNRGKTYRGKMGPGKWNEYFLEQIEGNKPREAVLIPLIVAGKVIGIFYGDDAGTEQPLGDVDKLEALITQTFSAIKLPSAERQSKHPG